MRRSWSAELRLGGIPWFAQAAQLLGAAFVTAAMRSGWRVGCQRTGGDGWESASGSAAALRRAVAAERRYKHPPANSLRFIIHSRLHSRGSAVPVSLDRFKHLFEVVGSVNIILFPLVAEARIPSRSGRVSVQAFSSSATAVAGPHGAAPDFVFRAKAQPRIRGPRSLRIMRWVARQTLRTPARTGRAPLRPPHDRCAVSAPFRRPRASGTY
jgi:hypothetical protein